MDHPNQLHPLVDVASVALEPLGTWPPDGSAISGEPRAWGLTLSDSDGVETGIWECSPGAFPSRRDGRSELMHFIAGEATITDADGTRHEILPGTARFFPDGWSGTWEIRRTVRKTYAMITTRPA